MSAPRQGGRLLADALLAQGVRIVYGVPGESYLPLLAALYDARERIRFVACRHEGGAAYMADAYAKLTGAPGVIAVTRGPGAANAAVGVHTAMQDASPLVVLAGQVGSDAFEREGFQEVELRRMYAPLAKWVGQVERTERIPEYVARAFHLARAGRPGPVVLAFPEDVLYREAQAADVPQVQVPEPAPCAAELARLERLLAQAERPLAIVGGSPWPPQAVARLRRWAEAAQMPVATAFRCQDFFDNRSPCYAGDVGLGINPALADRVRGADLLLVVGARLDEPTTGGFQSLIACPLPRQRLVHVHPAPEESGRVARAELAVCASPAAFVEALGETRPAPGRWRPWCEAARADYEAWRRPLPMPGAVQLGEVVHWLAAHLPEDAIVANGAGNFSLWLHRHYLYRGYRTQLAPANGSMGYGVAAAVGAAIADPQRLVLGWTGDGDFLMNAQELATAAREGARPVVVVVNNGLYGTIRMHQEREFPGRPLGSELANPDFALLARAFGGHGETVLRTEDFAPAFARAAASGRFAVIEIRIPAEAILPGATLESLAARRAC